MTQEEALAWIAGVFEESPEDVTPATHHTDLDAWDSLGVLTLMAGLDSDFDIVLDDEEILALESVDDILNLWARHGKVTGR